MSLNDGRRVRFNSETTDIEPQPAPYQVTIDRIRKVLKPSERRLCEQCFKNRHYHKPFFREIARSDEFTKRFEQQWADYYHNDGVDRYVTRRVTKACIGYLCYNGKS